MQGPPLRCIVTATILPCRRCAPVKIRSACQVVLQGFLQIKPLRSTGNRPYFAEATPPDNAIRAPGRYLSCRQDGEVRWTELRHREKESEEQWQTIRNSWTASTARRTTRASWHVGGGRLHGHAHVPVNSPPGCHDSVRRSAVRQGRQSWSRWRATRSSPVANGKLCMRCLDLPGSGEPPRPGAASPCDACARRPRRRDRSGSASAWDEGVRRHSREGQGHPRGDVRAPSASCDVHGTGRNVNWLVAACSARPPCRRRTSSTLSASPAFACYMPRVCGCHGAVRATSRLPTPP